MKAKELLENVNAKILGVVLNNIDVNESSYYGYYYQYYYAEQPLKTKRKKK